MKKILFFVAVVSVVLFAGCKKSSPEELAHSDLAASQLEGTWRHSLSLETEISTNLENPSEVSGTITSNSTTTLTLNKDQSFSMETNSEFVSYAPIEPTEEEAPLESMEEYFSKKVLVTGTFIATESLIQYDYQSVIVNEGAAMSFEEFVAANPDSGDKIQTVGWSIAEDKLYLDLYGDSREPELVYTRVQ